MKAIIIDDEPFSLQYLSMMCIRIPDLEIAGMFGNAIDAMEFLEQNPVNLVLTDIEMPGLNGTDAIEKIREINPGTGVIFITGYEEYAVKAFRLDAISYLMKPCTEEELEAAIKKAGKLLPDFRKRVVIRTFGSFALTVDGKPVHFSNRKAKELLALLVDRNGGALTMEQATDCLWEERPYDDMVKRLYRKAVSYLNQLCVENHMDFFVSSRGCCHIIPSVIECDYFMLLNGDRQARMSYQGDYLPEYSWAELTNGRLHALAGR